MIRIDKLCIRAGGFSLTDLEMEIPRGQCVALLGKSGSGKTTIMEALCGLREVTSGVIEIEGDDHTYTSPADRNIGLVPQDNVLFLTMTVRDHLAYGPMLRKWSKEDIELRVNEVASALKIDHLLDRKPQGLSGGESKRVAIGRAMAAKPNLLCLDESFTGLDDETRLDVMSVVKAAIQKEGMTTLLITHQKDEVEYMADVRYQIADGILV